MCGVERKRGEERAHRCDGVTIDLPSCCVALSSGRDVRLDFLPWLRLLCNFLVPLYASVRRVQARLSGCAVPSAGLVRVDSCTDCQSAEALRPWQRLQAACLCAPRGHPPTNRTRLGARYKTNVCELRFEHSLCSSAATRCETASPDPLSSTTRNARKHRSQ